MPSFSVSTSQYLRLHAHRAPRSPPESAVEATGAAVWGLGARLQGAIVNSSHLALSLRQEVVDQSSGQKCTVSQFARSRALLLPEREEKLFFQDELVTAPKVDEMLGCGSFAETWKETSELEAMGKAKDKAPYVVDVAVHLNDPYDC